ncbi:MAG: hypothetical protein K0Q52_163 [Microbacterium sp.]|jgi:hypothetical protein|nr:hypothetical protein [Microbacterium sp.]
MTDPNAPVMFAPDRAHHLFDAIVRKAPLAGHSPSLVEVDDAIGAVAQLFSDNAGWPPLDNDQVWSQWLLPRVLDRLGLDYDEVYEVAA